MLAATGLALSCAGHGQQVDAHLVPHTPLPEPTPVGVRNAQAPWAYPQQCAYVGLDGQGVVVIGREAGVLSQWQAAPNHTGFDGVVTAATPAGARVTVALSENATALPLTLELDCVDPTSVRYERVQSAPLPASVPWGAYLLDDGLLTAVTGCFDPPRGLCVQRRGEGVTGVIVQPIESSRYSGYHLALLSNATRSVLVADELGGPMFWSEIPSGGKAGPFHPLDLDLFDPESAPGTASCRVSLVPPYAGSPSDAAYIALCSSHLPDATGLAPRTHTSFGWLHLSERGELEAVDVWRGEGGGDGQTGERPGATPGENVNRLCGFGTQVDAEQYASHADRLVALYEAFDETVRALRGDQASWLVRTDGCGELVATCVGANHIERSQIIVGEGPIGLRVDGSDLVVVDASRTQRLRCEA